VTLINPNDLQNNLDRIENIEKTSLRLVVQALYDYRKEAHTIFQAESDQVADIGEDVTREALDRLGMPRVNQRLYGKVDYKRACYLFQPEFAVKQALFVDSKAEDISGAGTATLQITQLSMIIRQIRSGVSVSIPGKLATVLTLNDNQFLTTTMFVKYTYRSANSINNLQQITIAAVPNGMLQDRYNPDENDTIWRAGRNAPSLGEEFRVRLSFPLLKSKARWRVQTIPMDPLPYLWDE
jgi:hypothetical protein